MISTPWIIPDMFSIMTTNEREPTPDEAAGMAWWNGLTVVARNFWAEQTGDIGAPIAECWAEYKRQQAAKKDPPR